ncbi:nitrous oxide-stimulated promoter family protein [Teredinibacter sp. KSP-S5-2]|uniref:nitrous oxide-stimulated promoter family protein n=1 Tax=Teredinibacter sp. KSP-S5-2 TaxID=3034506 RepID=UPI002934C68A|nr:nitrous oxide-stimulated promoter family protein [Teredinibacter sp. KSP-S5-2]WNO11174.1 nitrous oxide-stimulated promoter family protein [Teredinibacter sp. KSP-S5-2]
MVFDSRDKGELLTGSLKTEFKTVYYMVLRYCRDHHQQDRDPGKDLCSECSDLIEYAAHRLDCCPYGQDKPTCNRCPIHCYKPEQKQQMRLVMKYSGPRMLLSHPILALRHLFHEHRLAAEKPKINASNKRKRMREKG